MPLTQISPSPLRLVRRILAMGAILILVSAYVHAQTTSFTYQGRLTDSGAAANGNYDLQFALFDSASGGAQIGSTLTRSSVSVSGGVFTVQLDFGVSAFPGADRFLEIGVRPAGVGSFTTLSPRQQISSTPYAIRTLSATTADALSSVCVACVQDSQINQVAGSKVNGTIPIASVPDLGASYIKNTTGSQTGANFNISGDGTAGGTLSGNAVNATTQYNIGSSRVLSTTGSGGFINLFVGPGAGEANTTGSGNVFVGGGAGQANTKGFNNSFVGVNAGRNNIGGDPSLLGSGTGNSFFGAYAGLSNTQGFANSFFGSQAGESNVTGLANAFFGFSAGQNNTVGGNNAFFGVNSGLRNTTGCCNAFFGGQAGQSNTTGTNNTTIGYYGDVGAGNLTNATAIGGNARVDQSNSLVLGSIAGVNGATSSVNVGIGTTNPGTTLDVRGNLTLDPGSSPVLYTSASSGEQNRYLQLINSPSSPSASGLKAGGVLVADSYGYANPAKNDLIVKGNVGIGTATPKHHVAVIGGPSWTTAGWAGAMEFANASAIGWQNNLAGWHFGIGQTSGGLYFFQTSSELGMTLSPPTYIMTLDDGGRVGIGTTSPDRLLSVNGGASKTGGGSWDVFSDEGLKNIKGRFTSGLRAVMQLQPLRYEYKRDNALNLTSDGEHIGFSAQAVQRVVPEAVTKDDRGYLLVNNDPIMWTMLNAIKEQQQQIEELKGQIRQLRSSVHRRRTRRRS